MDQIDVNAASEEQLQQLQGIGPALAKRIVEYRNREGPFASTAELARVKGIYPAVLAAISEHVIVGKREGEHAPEAVTATPPVEAPALQAPGQAKPEVLVEAGLAPPPEFIEKDVPPRAREWPSVFSQAEEKTRPASITLRGRDMRALAAGIALLALAVALLIAMRRLAQQS